ncbi:MULTISPECIES: hypothetical protein [Bacteroidota]|uniref:Uncharacterized protein n=2 Tax=Bacteroidota TaxID=976 RepID=A0AA37SQJ4_9BACT|nr:MULTISPECIES: hypothetical protein [Bacteroidota]AKP52866.1 hypothetical protein CA2015_3480 [Cyclobacterium amurskyense]GLR18227.1 hypothetical protein GCM10007940_28420 [Portibacter lacus]|tara:strand:- start:2426 stop:2971 length:546 start_codon:yes stop_codon:yes gene_type:complete
MKKILHVLSKKGQYKIAFPIIILGFVLQAILILKYLPEFLSYSNGVKNPDQLFSYNFEYLSNLYQQLGEEGRAFYSEMLGVDFLYTTISGIGYCLLLAALVKKEKWYIILPLFLAISDVFENISQLLLMSLFPKISTSEVSIASIFTSTKMTLSIICVVLILFFIVKNVFNWIKTRSDYEK